jgi:hypothetical protein
MLYKTAAFVALNSFIAKFAMTSPWKLSRKQARKTKGLFSVVKRVCAELKKAE